MWSIWNISFPVSSSLFFFERGQIINEEAKRAANTFTSSGNSDYNGSILGIVGLDVSSYLVLIVRLTVVGGAGTEDDDHDKKGSAGGQDSDQGFVIGLYLFFLGEEQTEE